MRILPLAVVALLAPGCLGSEPWLDVWVGYVGDMLPYESIPVRLKSISLVRANGETVDLGSDWTVDLSEDGSKVAWRGERPDGRFTEAKALTAPGTVTLRGGRAAEVVASPLRTEWDGRGDPWFGVTLQKRADGRFELVPPPR